MRKYRSIIPFSETQKTLKTESFFKTQWQQNLTWLELKWCQDSTIYSFYSSHWVGIFMHFAQQTLMCLITECFPRPCWWSCYIIQSMYLFLHSEKFRIQKINVRPQKTKGCRLRECGLTEEFVLLLLRYEERRGKGGDRRKWPNNMALVWFIKMCPPSEMIREKGHLRVNTALQ